jgi:hypothetical protein
MQHVAAFLIQRHDIGRWDNADEEGTSCSVENDAARDHNAGYRPS